MKCKEKNLTTRKINTTLTRIYALFLFCSCIIPPAGEPESNTNGNNFSKNFVFTYAFLTVSASKANYCPQPSLILRKNIDYPINLETNKPFYFHYSYSDNVKPPEEIRSYFFKITKQNGTSVSYRENSNCNSQTSSFSTVTPTVVAGDGLSVTYNLSFPENFQPASEIQKMYSVSLDSGDPNITLRQE